MSLFKTNKASPWLLNFFRWYCHPDYVEDLEGDLLETFERTKEQSGPQKANWILAINVIKLFRPGIIRSFNDYQFSHYDMFKNNLKIAVRNLIKHKSYAFINVLGLAIGMTCCLLIFLYVNHELTYDSFHSKSDRIYRVVTDIKTPTETINTGVTSAPMTAYMKTDFPEVEDFVRLDPSQFLLSDGEKSYQEDNGMFADASFFKIFTFPLVKGNAKTALVDPFSVVLTESAAKKYFGDQPPMGKVLKLEGEYDLTVTGIMQDVPQNSNFSFDVLVSLSTTLEEIFPRRAEQWGNFAYNSYVLLLPNALPSALENKLPDFMEKYYGETMDRDEMHYSLFLEPLSAVYLKSERGSPRSGNQINVMVFSIIACLILIIACFNFMNLSTARATERAKEVGIRKVIGAIRWQLTIQFLSEALLMSMLAFILALLACEIVIPSFNQLAGKQIVNSIFYNFNHLAVFGLFAIFVGLLAGFYPAYVLSNFNPVSILKGKFSSSQTGLVLRKVLVTSQFVISITLIAGTAIVYNQLGFMRDKSLGFKKNQMLVIDFHGDNAIQEKINVFKQQLSANPQILGVSASSSVPSTGNNGAFSVIENPSGDLQSSNLAMFYVDHEFFDLFELEMVAGRQFSRDMLTDSAALIVNEATVASYGYQQPEAIIGKQFSQWGVEGQVIGVVKDFHYASLQQKIEPLSIRLEPDNAMYLTFNIESTNISNTIASLEEKWKKLAPQRPFEYFFIDESFNQQYAAEVRFGDLFTYFAGLAVFIACLGLLGLISYTSTQRKKEIGIRKVLGANKLGLIKLLTQDILRLIVIAFFVALPITWFTLSKWLQSFAYQTEISPWVFIIAGLMALGVSFAAISYQAFKAALSNPIEALKNE